MKTKFTNQTIPFLKKAGKQKKSDWLEQNEKEYNKVLKDPFVELAEYLSGQFQVIAGDYHFPSRVGRIKKLSNKIGLDGVLYKDWVSLAASRPSGSRFEKNPHIFFGILPNEVEWQGVVVAGGLLMPSGPQLKRIRRAIAKNSKPFHDLFNDPKFKARFKKSFSLEKSAIRVPQAHDPDHPDIEWIKLKSFLVVKKLTMKEFTSPKLSESILKDFIQLLRLNRLLEEAIRD